MFLPSSMPTGQTIVARRTGQSVNASRSNKMSPQLIHNVLNQNWFVASHVKEMSRSVSVFEANRVLEMFNALQNAAAKFIRKISHHKSLLLLIIYCLILSNNCINFVNCDIEPQPMNNISDDDDDGATKQLVSFHISIIFTEYLFRSQVFPSAKGKNYIFC